MVTHDADIGRSAHRVIRLRDGRVARVDDQRSEPPPSETLIVPRRASTP
jgi:hypothetical protein